MFEVVETFMVQFIDLLPVLIPLILIINLACDLLFGGRS